jgi:glycosyltransferase involved in cell wall biosynthesis
MTTTLRVTADQLATPIEPDLSSATAELTHALIEGAPQGCEVELILPAVPDERVAEILEVLPGVAGVHKTALARRELAAALQLGVATGIGAGLIHSPTLFAPLVRHDRVHDHDQTVVTVWDLRPWEAASELPRTTVAWHRAMLKRAVKHADAVVVPTHTLGERLAEIAPLGDRIRVIPGASPIGFAVPTDEIGRRRSLGLPEGFVVLAGGAGASDGLELGFGAVAAARIDLPVVVIEAEEGEEPAIAELASARGIPERRLHVRGSLSAADRAAVYGGAVAALSTATRDAFPWRAVDALTLGVPTVATATGSHRETIFDGGLVVDADAAALGDALATVLRSAADAHRFGVLAADRGRVFSWSGAADREWHLHAEL